MCFYFCTSKPVQSPSHLRHISRHLSTRQYWISQANVGGGAGNQQPQDQNMDYEMQSMTRSSENNHTLYVEAASIEVLPGSEAPLSTVRQLAFNAVNGQVFFSQQTNTGTGTLYGALVWSIYVPTQVGVRPFLVPPPLTTSYHSSVFRNRGSN